MTQRKSACIVAAVMTALIGCSEDVPITTGPDIAYGEFVARASCPTGPPEDFVIVGRPEVLGANAEVLLQPIANTVNFTKFTLFRPNHLTWIRLAVLAPEDVGAFLDSVAACDAFDGSCVPDQPSYAERYPLPYGYGVDAEQWRAGSECLLAGFSDCELATIDGPAFGAWGRLTVLWVEDEVTCPSGEQCPSTPLDHVRELLVDDGLARSLLHLLGSQPDPSVVERVVRGFDREPLGPLWIPKILVGDDGLAACVMREMLPGHGEITHCDQLTDFGRGFDTLNADGRELCLIDRQPEPPMGTSGPPGFYLTEQDPAAIGHRAIVLDVDLIPGSTYEWRCEIDYDAVMRPY